MRSLTHLFCSQALAPVATALAISVLTGHHAGAQSVVATDAPRTSAFTGEGPLRLHDAMARALSSNADLAAAARDVEAAKGPILQGGARPNPTLSALLEGTRSSSRTGSVLLDQPVELGGKRAARLEAAERARDLAVADLQVRRSELRAAVVLAFHQVLLAQERVALAADSEALAGRAFDAAGKRVLAGKVSPVEETRARVAQSIVRLEAAQAQSELASARQRLAATWGHPTPRFERVENPGGSGLALPLVPSQEVIEQRLVASPSLRRAQVDVERRKALTRVERTRQMPDLTVTLGVRREQQTSQAVIGLAVPLPVYDANQGNLLEALRREEKSYDELAAADIRQRVSVQQARNQLEVFSAEALTLRDSVIPGADSAYVAATRGFQLGKFNFLEVLDAQRTLLQAKAQYLRALGEAYRAAADIDTLIGDSTAVPASVPPNNASHP